MRNELEQLLALTYEEHAEAHGLADDIRPYGGSGAAFPARGGRTTGDGAFLVPEESARQLSVQVAQLGRIVAVLARRMEDMEAQSARLITVSHAQALQLGKLIRGKAQAVAQRYGLPADSEKKIRAAIKKELLTRIGVRDLHDTPLAAWDRAAGIIDGWSNIGLIMEMRKSKNG